MTYDYSGDAHRELVAAYRADEPPFPTDASAAYPRRDALRDELPLLRQLLFPCCWNATELLDDPETTRARLTDLGARLHRGIAAYAEPETDDPAGIVDRTLDRLPAIRRTLKRDVEAAYKGDPAAKSYCEIIRSYPGFQAVLTHRVAHRLYEEERFAYARELAEYAKTETGIDIHPGAEIGEYFFIDHGTGVVIGAGSNVLGAIEIGDDVSIGANSWVTDDVPDDTSVFVADHPDQRRKSND